MLLESMNRKAKAALSFAMMESLMTGFVIGTFLKAPLRRISAMGSILFVLRPAMLMEVSNCERASRTMVTASTIIKGWECLFFSFMEVSVMQRYYFAIRYIKGPKIKKPCNVL